MRNAAIIAIDIGGTNVKFAVLTSAPPVNILKLKKVPTARGKENLLNQVKTIISVLMEEYSKKNNITGIAIATAGRIDTEAGEIVYANENLPGWTGTPLKSILEKDFNLPVLVENDVNAAAWAEYVIRDLKDETMACITLGTGLGAGLIINGQLLRGNNSRAGELGYMKIAEKGRKMGNGKQGCWEMFVAKNGILQTASQYYSEERNRELTVKKIFDSARRGENEALKTVEETGFYLARGLENIIYTIDPAYIIIGGGIAGAGDILLEAIENHLYNKDIKKDQVKLDLACLGNKAGILGAANLLNNSI